MALRIGKKTDASSDAAAPGTAGDTASTPMPPTTATTTAPADPFAPAVAPKKSLSPVLLAAGVVLLLSAVGVGAFMMFSNAVPEDTEAPIVPAAVAPDPAMDPAVDPGAAPEAPQAPAAPPQTAPAAPTANDYDAPGRAGITPPNTQAPSVRPQPGQPPATAPQPNQPTPVPIMPDGIGGQRGKGLHPGNTIPVVQPIETLPPELQTQLKTLWQQGAAAKWRGDHAAARSAWTKMLQLRPGHPGVQEAINKLPK